MCWEHNELEELQFWSHDLYTIHKQIWLSLGQGHITGGLWPEFNSDPFVDRNNHLSAPLPASLVQAAVILKYQHIWSTPSAPQMLPATSTTTPTLLISQAKVLLLARKVMSWFLSPGILWLSCVDLCLYIYNSLFSVFLSCAHWKSWT
jgi:hypothetical protein